jgi:hypothetical protein
MADPLAAGPAHRPHPYPRDERYELSPEAGQAQPERKAELLMRRPSASIFACYRVRQTLRGEEDPVGFILNSLPCRRRRLLAEGTLLSSLRHTLPVYFFSAPVAWFYSATDTEGSEVPRLAQLGRSAFVVSGSPFTRHSSYRSGVAQGTAHCPITHRHPCSHPIYSGSMTTPSIPWIYYSVIPRHSFGPRFSAGCSCLKLESSQLRSRDVETHHYQSTGRTFRLYIRSC